MLTSEDLLAISELLDKKFPPIKEEIRQLKDESNRKYDLLAGKLQVTSQELRTELKGDMQQFRDEMKGDMQQFKDEMKGDMQQLRNDLTLLCGKVDTLELTLKDDILPRLNTIESCYVDTAQRYLVSAEKMDSLETDVTMLKSVSRAHSRMLRELTEN